MLLDILYLHWQISTSVFAKTIKLLDRERRSFVSGDIEGKKEFRNLVEKTFWSLLNVEPIFLIRGGLVRINSNFFSFIRRVEPVVQKILILDFLWRYYGEDLLDHLKGRLQNNHFETLGWQTFPVIILTANCQKFCLTKS